MVNWKMGACTLHFALVRVCLCFCAFVCLCVCAFVRFTVCCCCLLYVCAVRENNDWLALLLFERCAEWIRLGEVPIFKKTVHRLLIGAVSRWTVYRDSCSFLKVHDPKSSKRTKVPRYLGPMPNSGTLVLCQTVKFKGPVNYLWILYCTVLYCTVQYSTCTVLYSTVLVDRHGDQGRHVLRHVRGQNRGSTLSGGEFKLAFMGSKVYS